MTHSSTRTKLIAAITVLAVALACVFAAIFYTRTQDALTPEEVPSGESATSASLEFPSEYGGKVGTPSGTAITDQNSFYEFINGSATYGYLANDITIGVWQQGNLVLEEGRTLDGNGHTVQINNANTELQSVYNGTGIRLSEDSSGGTYSNWWGMSGGTSYSLSNGKLTYAFSDLVSANYGTIKNLKVNVRGNGNNGDTNDHIRISQYTGNAVMGVVAGYNAGVIQNVSVTVNDRYGIVPSHYVHHDQEDQYVYGVVAEQYMVAVGGVAGYNEGTILSAKVSLNADLGIFNADKEFVTQYRGWGAWDQYHGDTENYRIDSGSVGGVAGVNDGGNILGIDFYGGNCWIYNTVKHQQPSYIGVIAGLANLGETETISRTLKTGESWTIRRGRINYLTISANSSFSLNMRSAGYNAIYKHPTEGWTDINSYGTERSDLITSNTIFGGVVGGLITENGRLNEYIVFRNCQGLSSTKFSAGRTGADSGATAVNYTATPVYGSFSGYSSSTSYTDYGKTLTSILTRFEGQSKVGNNTDITTQGASASYIWSGVIEGDNVHAGLVQNINFDGISDLNGHPYNIYKFEGYAGGTRTSYKGSDNIYGDDLGDSHLLRLPVYSTGGNIDLEYRYALTCTTLPDAASVDAFFGVNSGSGFGYAYANAVILSADNTVSGTVSPSGSRVFPAWKTFDGQGRQLTFTSGNAVSGSGATVNVGGMQFNAYGDLVSINNGVINNVVFRQIGGGERADITGVSGNAAYGNVVGVNNGTMNAVYHNNAGGEALRTVVSTSGAYLALGGVAGINLGTINDTASIAWNDFQGSAQTGTFVGGVVGLNMGGGTLKNAKIDGVATATMKASGGEAYLGGVLGLGANGSNGGRTVGGLSVTSSLTSSPFENWFFAGKQTLNQTSGAYVGMLSGGVTSNPNETDRPLLGMIVLMPDTQYDLGWFTDRTNTPSLLGRSNGAASAQGYIATSMVGGYSVVAQDASNLYISAAISDYNGSLINGAFSGTFAIDTTYIRGTAEPIVYYEHIADVGATVSGDAISVPSNASGLSVIDNTDNTENYAQTIALRYVYEIGIDQTANDADGSTSEHALRLFLSGDALGAGLEKYPGSYKAIAAGATAAVVTSDLTVSANPNGIVFAAPKTSLDGGGHTVTINNNLNGTLQGGATYELGGVVRNVYGELVAINRAEITNVKLNIAGSRSLSGDNVVYGAIGVNVGGTGDIGNEVLAYIDGVDVTWAQNVSLSGGGDQIFGGIVGIVGYPGNVDNSDLVVNGNVSLTGSYYRANVGAYGYIFGGSDGGVDGTKATWMGDVTMTGADNADVIFGGVAATFNTGNLVGASATFGSTASWQGYLDGHLYDKAFDLTVNGGNVMAGGVVGHMPGDGNLKNSSALFNVDFDVVQTGAAGDYNVDVGGVIGQITAGEVTSATVSGLGAIAVTAAAGANIRLGGAVGAAGTTPKLSDVKAMLAGGLYNVNTPGDYGWWSGYNEGGVTVNDAVFAVHDGKEYSAENAYGGSPKTPDGTTSLGGGYRITDASDRDVDYLAINPNGMTAFNMGPVFAASWNFGSASAVTVAVTDGAITEYKLSSSVKVYTNDNKRDEYMLRSALAGVPYAAVTDPSVYGQSKYRYYGWYAGAQTVSLTQSGEFSTQDFNIYLYDTEIGFVWGAGRTLEGNSDLGYKVTVAGAMGSNIAPQEMIWREESGDGTTEVVNSGLYAARGMFLAVNNGVVSNVNVIISNGTSGGGDIKIDYATVMETAEDAYPSDKQGVPGSYDGYAGVIFGMFVGVNAGTISGVNALSYDRVTTIEVTGGYEDKDLVVGGMVGAQIGADSSIGGAGTMTFGDGDGIAVTSSTGLNRISVGGWIGMVSNEDNDTSADGLEVVMKAYSFIDIDAPHNFAALGGIVGDLRGVMSDARIDTEYLSRMLVGGTRQNGTAALGNLVGVANGATIERAVVKGVGYLYNGIDENSAQQSSSVDLYSGGAIGLASNWAQDTSIATNTYKRINPSTLDSVYVDFEGYLRAVNGSKVGLITGRLFDGVTVAADGTTVTTNIDTTKLKNIVWKVNYYGDVPWASSAYINNVSTVFNERTELAVYGYAAADVDGYHEGLAKSGMRLWVTNNRYSGETNNEIDAEWTDVGKLKFTVTNITGATDYESFTAYFNGATGEGGAALEGEQGITRLTTYHALDSGDPVQPSATVDIADRLSSFVGGTVDYSHGVYVIRFIFNEVYIYNQAELMTFITEGRNTVSNKTASTAASALTDGGTDRTGTYAAGQYGLAKTEARYNELKNADIGILANNIEVDFGATAATMPSHKTLDGQGFTVTLTANGQVTAHQMWSNRDNNASDSGPAEEYAVGNLVSEQENVRSYVSGGKEAGTTGGDYVTTDQGSSHFDATTLDQMTNTEAKVGATIGGLFMGRNLGTIANINFVLKNSVTVFNDNYGSLMVAGIVTAVNAGTIENCSLTLGANATFRAFRDNCSTKDKTNNTDYGEAGARINSVATVGGYAGMMFKYEARSANTAYIRNSTLTLESGSMITVDNEFPTYTWIGMYTSVTSYSGGLVGWMLDGGEIYNVILNGEGDVKALASFEGRDNIWNSSYMVGVAGIIVGMNAVYPVFNPIIEVGHTQDNFGYINGVICNWNGNVEYNARYSSGVGGSPADYYDANHWNYSLGGQMIGVSQTDTIQNVYFMYGVENYATYHRDNWWYGDSVAARAANESFHNKYDYVVSQSIKLLNEHLEWDAIYAPVNKNGPNGNSANNSYGDELVPVAHRVNGEVVQGADFTFENYNNYHSADSEANGSIFKGVEHVVDNDWGFQLYKTDLDANGQPTYYGDITRSHYHKIVELYPDTQADDNKSHDMVGARTSGRFANISTALDYSYQYAPNNVYIYEVAFGESEERELDMNDPNTVASMSFETDQITSDIRLDFELYTDENLAQFIWSIEEEWDYTPESGIPDTSTPTDYYNTVNSLEEAMRNNKFDRTMRRDNDSVNIRITYWVGSAVAIAPDLERYDTVMRVGEDENGETVVESLTYYDTQPYVYNGSELDLPTLYYVSYKDPTIKVLDDPAVLAENMFDFYKLVADADGNLQSPDRLSGAPHDAGEYYIRLLFEDETGADTGLKVNTSQRTVMFGVGTDYYDFYTAILPSGISGVSVTKVYDGTDKVTNDTVFTYTASPEKTPEGFLIGGSFAGKDQGEQRFTADDSKVMFFRTVNGSGTSATVSEHKIMLISDPDGNATNFAVVRQRLSDGATVAADIDGYYNSGTVSFNGSNSTITPYKLTLDDFTFLVTDGAGDEWRWTGANERQVQYRHDYYYTEAAFEGSTVNIAGAASGSTTFDRNGVISGMLADDDRVTLSYLFGGAESVRDKGEYETTITLVSTNGNYVLEPSPLNIGTLIITEIVIQETSFAYSMEDIFRIYDGTKPNATADLFDGTLTVTDPNGYVLNTDDATYKLTYTINGDAINVSEDGYTLTVTVSDFESNNYMLPGGVTSFDIDIEGARLYITPKLIEFKSIVKQYDGTGEQTDDTVFTYAGGAGPIADDEGIVFIGEYTDGYLTAGDGKPFKLATTPISLGGTKFEALDVQGDDANINYFVENAAVNVGGITPIEVQITGVRMLYSGRANFDYRDPYKTEITITGLRPDAVIRPEGSFVNARVGEGKDVTMKTDSVSVYDDTFDVLVASEHDGSDSPNATEGDNFPGNYYISNDTFRGVGVIYQYTIEGENFSITIVQEWNGKKDDFTVQGASLGAGGELTYHRDNEFSGSAAEEGSGWGNEDDISKIIDVAIAREGGGDGNAGTYVVTLTIVGVDGGEPDYKWADGLDATADGELKFEFTVNRQVVSDKADAIVDSGDSYVYNGGAQDIEISASVSDNDGNVLSLDATPGTLHNDDLNSTHTLRSLLPIGDYTAAVGVALSADDEVNYTYTGGDTTVSFAVTPAPVTVNSVSKEFDNTDATATAGNEAVFDIDGIVDATGAQDFAGEAYYLETEPQKRGDVVFPSVRYNIGGNNYDVLTVRGKQVNHFIKDADSGNDAAVVAAGDIDKYLIGADEITTYIYGYTSGAADKTMSEAVDGTQFEYRAGATYAVTDVVFGLSDMRYGFAADGTLHTPAVGDITTLTFTVTIDGAADAVALPGNLDVGEYTISVSLNNDYFTLDQGAANGVFEIVKQSVSGGSQDPDNPDAGFTGGNVFITADLYSYAYGESGYNGPVVGDEKVVLTVTVTDKYDPLAKATFDKTVVTSLLYGPKETRAALITGTDGLFVGEYLVWATAFTEELGNYAIPTDAVIPVFPAGTPPTQTDEDGNVIGARHTAVYAITPAAVEITSVDKTYDGTTSFTGATTITAAPQEVAAAITGSYLSPDATHASDGVTRIEGQGNTSVVINTAALTVQNTSYNMIATSGVAGNYCVQGAAAEGGVQVDNVAIIRRLVIADESAVTITSQKFAKPYDATADVVIPPEGISMEMTVNFPAGDDGTTPAPLVVTLTPTAEGLIFLGEDGVPLEAAPTDVGAYGVALAPVGMGNFELPSGVNVPVTPTTTHAEGDRAIYYIEPVELTISQLSKTYDGSAALTENTVFAARVALDVVTVTRDMVAVAFDTANIGIGKSALVSVVAFTLADGTTVYRVLGADGVTPTNFCVQGTLSGAAVAVTAPAEAEAPFTIAPAPLTLNAGTVTKTYDGTTAITTAPAAAFTGFVPGETIAPDWYYDSANAGTRNVLVRVDNSTSYVVGDVTYFAVMTAGEEGAMGVGNYGVDSALVSVQKVWITDAEGERVQVEYAYAVYTAGGRIEPYEIGGVEDVYVGNDPIANGREYDRTPDNSLDFVVVFGGTEVAVSMTGSTASVTTPFSQTAVNAEDGTETTTQDRLTLRRTWSPSAPGNVGSYTLTIELSANANYTMSDYTGTFVVSPKELDGAFAVIASLGKEYNGTPGLPALDRAMVTFYGVDDGLVLLNNNDFAIDAEGGVTFVDEEGAVTGAPVNVLLNEDGSVGGYAFRLTGVTFTNTNYIWDTGVVTRIYVSYDAENGYGAQTLYTINPRQLTVNADSLTDKTFDGAFSLSVNTGVEGEYAIVGDANGAVRALAGVYSGVTITPTVLGVTFDSSALNQTTTAANYTIAGGEVTIDSLTIGTGNVLTAERALGEYRIGFGGMAGLDFLADAGADEAAIAEAIAALTATAESGKPLRADGYTSGDPVALLNAALISLFEVKLNTAEVTLEGGKLYFNDFLWSAVKDGMGRTTYSLTFSFTGVDGYDEEGYATDRYEFKLKGATAADGAQYIPSTNVSLTSSELAPGQLAAATQTAGTAIATADDLLAFLEGGSGSGYLTADIYGFDAAGEGVTFGGTLYGNGHTIQLTPSDLAAVQSGGYNAYGALVAVNNGTIRDVNLKLMGCDLAFEQSSAVFGAVGVNNGSLINVGVEIVGGLVVDGAAYVGGLAGVNAAGGTITDCAATVSGAVNMTSTSGETVTPTPSGTFGGLAGRAGGAMTRVAAYGSGSVSAADGGAVVGEADGLTIDGVIAAAAWGVKGVVGSGTPTVSGLYVNTAADLGVTADALGIALSLLAPHEEGFIQYYFTSEGDFTSGGVRHNEFGSADETNMSGYGVYADDLTAVIAVEAIAPAGRYVWEGYGINYRTVGTALNRIVGVFALGSSLSDQYDETATITPGVGAFTVALGIYGSTVVAEDTSSVKEVVYNGQPQSYKVTLTIDGTETEIEVTGTDVGYYSRSFVEGIISGSGETVGNITFDDDGRVAITVTGGGSSVADGIALIIYPKTSSGTAEKYYDGNSAADVVLTDGEGVIGGVYLDGNYDETFNAKDAAYASVVNEAAAVRNVAVDEEGNFVALITAYETVDGQLQAVVKIVPVTIETQDGDVPFGLTTDITAYTSAQIMRAYVMLTDFADLEEAAEGGALDISGYHTASVLAITASLGGEVFDEEAGAFYFAPQMGNYIVTSTDWTLGATTIAAEGYDWSTAEKYTVPGTINPIDLKIGVTISGADQSYNYPIKLPTTSGGAATVGMGFDEAAEKYGLTQDEYNLLCSQAKNIKVDAVSGMFAQLVKEGKLVENGDGTYSAATKEYQQFTIATSGGGTDKSGNFIVGASGTLTLRYFKPEIAEDGKTTYLLGSVADWRALQSNEGGAADYNTLDYRLSADIDFGGKGAMLAWHSEGNRLDFTGTLDGDEYVLSNIFEFNEGVGAKSALIESIGEGGVVSNLTVVNSVFDAFGDNTVTAGIAIENHGTIENCTFEGTLAGGSKSASKATLAGLVANNFGTIKGGTAVADGLIFAAENGTTDAVGIAFNRDNAETETAASVENSNAVAAIYAYGGASGTLGGAVDGSNAGGGNGYVQGLATRNGAVVADGDTSSAKIVWSDNASIKSVIESYVFNSELVSYDGSKLDTDNFRKLIAALRLFEFVGAADVTHQNAAAWGKYAAWLAAHALN